MTQRSQFRRKMHRIMLQNQPKTDKELIACLRSYNYRIYQRGNTYGVFLGNIKFRLKTIQKDYKEYMKKREQLKSLGKEHDARTLEPSKPTRGAKQVAYMEKLERLKAISEEKEREHEKENEQNDHDHERE